MNEGEACVRMLLLCSRLEPSLVPRVLNLSLKLSPPWMLGVKASTAEDSPLHDTLLKGTV